MTIQTLCDTVRLKSLELAAIAAQTEEERKAVLVHVHQFIDELTAREIALVEESADV